VDRKQPAPVRKKTGCRLHRQYCVCGPNGCGIPQKIHGS
jgi:hypothetical protein